MWSLRIALARLRPFDASTTLRTLIVVAVVALFLVGDYALFRRLFGAVANVERETPAFAIALLRNLLGLVFLTATVILFSSSLTAAIGSFFADLDLDVYHAAPRSKLRIAVTRWIKTLLHASAVVFLFLIPLVIAFAQQHAKGIAFVVVVLIHLALLLSIPVSLASTAILLLVRWFPVRRVHQIVASLAVLVLAVAVIGFRMTRPERFFANAQAEDVTSILRRIELPSMSLYPGTELAQMMTAAAMPVVAPRILITALLAFALFALVARSSYFTAFVRARESMAPVAIGATAATRIFDRLLARADPPLRALLAKEVRTVTRDAAQWSQIFLMAALVFIYLYNIRMMPLGGDARASLVAYANVGMTGFMIAAICLRFAYPSVSAEGRAFWLVQTAPVSYRQFLRVKVFVYATPLTLLALTLTALGNFLLDANAIVWVYTLCGASLLAVTLASLGVGLGGLRPKFDIENPLQVGLSLGGFAYMAIAMAYVATMMVLMARPVMRYVLARVLSVTEARSTIGYALPVVIALTLSVLLSVIPIRVAERRLIDIRESD